MMNNDVSPARIVRMSDVEFSLAGQAPIPEPSENDLKRWLSLSEKNSGVVVLINYSPGFYVTYGDHCYDVWINGVTYVGNSNEFGMAIVQEDVLRASVLPLLSLNKKPCIVVSVDVHVLRQYEPGGGLFHHNTFRGTTIDKVIEGLKTSIPAQRGVDIVKVLDFMDLEKAKKTSFSSSLIHWRLFVFEVERIEGA